MKERNDRYRMDTANNVKICVYGICKNESKFIDRWYSWAKHADYIRILDTGSTDDSVEKLSKLDKVEVHTAIIDPWRFDVARNMSMQYIPEDTDVCCVADFDQVWRDGWDIEIRGLYEQGYNDILGDMIDYDENGNEEKRFLSKNVHSNDKGWHWERPIHEGLQYNGDKEIKTYVSSTFTIEHHPDRSKSRDSYLELLEIEYKENSKDPLCMIYYGCELLFHSREDEAIDVFVKGINDCDFRGNTDVLYQTLLNLSIIYLGRNQYEEALAYGILSETTGVRTRKLFYHIANVYDRLNNFNACKEYCIKALSVQENVKAWIEDQELFKNYQIYDLLSCSEFMLGDKENAYLHSLIAHYYNPDDPRVNYNYNLFKEEIRKYKVCVYAICKNESKNIDLWYQTVKEADYIFVLDTGSTDDSMRLLEEKGVNVFDINYGDNFSFGKARQKALEEASYNYPDADIFVTVDFDEFLRYDWYLRLQQEWDPEYECLIAHGYNLDGTPNCDSNNKIHTSDLSKVKWVRDIHEFIMYKNNIVHKSSINYTHVQDLTKDRNYYEYTKKAYYRKDRTILDCVYFAWESSLKGNMEDYYDANLTALGMYTDANGAYKDDVSFNDKETEAQVCINLGTYCYSINNLELAYTYYNIASKLDLGFKYRRIYCIKAFLEEKLGRFKEALEDYKSALEISVRPYCWIENDMYYKDAYVETKICRLLRNNLNGSEEDIKYYMELARDRNPDSPVVKLYFNTGILMNPKCELE